MKTLFYYHGIHGGKTQALDGSIFIICVSVCPVCMSMYYTTCIECPQRPEEGIRSPGTGVTDTITHRVYAGDRTQDFIQQEQPVLLTTELSLQPEL